MLDLKRVLAAAPRKPDGTPLEELLTPWGEALLQGEESPEPLHPHPQFARDSFVCLEGMWDYAIVDAPEAATARRDVPAPATWDGTIRVPFSPEAPLSGVGRQLQPRQLLWYRLRTACPAVGAGQRLILHFEAVDWACRCIVNGCEVGGHTGGYMPFSFDITEEAATGGAQLEVQLCVWDPSDSGVQLRGKQRLQRGGIWYTAQSGIWQTPWLEAVPNVHLRQARILPDPDGEMLQIIATANAPSEVPLQVRVFADGGLVAEGQATATEPFPALLQKEREFDQAISVAVPVSRPRLWSPDDPFLYQLELTLGTDRVRSYCAFRTVAVQAGADGLPRFFLNHQPLFIRGVLDQGYWPDGLMTAPSTEAMTHDITAMKDAGFNLLRKHIKVEQDRWYYLCDKLGMLVWQDMVSGGGPLSPWHSSYKPTLFRNSWTTKADTAPRDWRHLSADSADYRPNGWPPAC